MSDRSEVRPTEMPPQEAVRLLFSGHVDESGRFWTVFSAMSAANSVFFGLIAQGDQGRLITVLASLLGLAICSIWAGVQPRFDEYCRWYDDRLEQLAPKCQHVLTLIPDQAIRRTFHGDSLRRAGVGMPWLFWIAWLLLAPLRLWG